MNSTPNTVDTVEEVEASTDLDEYRIKLVERGLKITNIERTLAGYRISTELCFCDCCRVARGEPLSSYSKQEAKR